MSKSRNPRNPRNAAKTVEAPEAPKADKVDYTVKLIEAVNLFVADTSTEVTEADILVLQASYRAIPAGARGKAGIAALKASGSRMADVLDAFNNLPTVTASRTKVEMSDSTKAAILSVAILAVASELVPALDVSSISSDFDVSGHEDLVSDTSEKLRKILSGVKVGKGRTHKVTKLSDLIADGTLPVGSTLSGPNDAKCVVEATGTVSAQVGSKAVSGSLSEVAGKFAGHSVNGWAFWSIDGNKLDSLRLS